jgi:hypothetical protein
MGKGGHTNTPDEKRSSAEASGEQILRLRRRVLQFITQPPLDQQWDN